MNESVIAVGLCRCGCGAKTSIAKANDARQGYKKGQPVRFISGHSSRVRPPKGRKTITNTAGYGLIYLPNHPRADNSGYVLAHIPICENVLGKPLPIGAKVHHVDENKANNRHDNLVICESNAYHQLLHQRMRALRACGHANWRKCYHCKVWAHPDSLGSRPNESRGWHRHCRDNYNRNYHELHKEEASRLQKEYIVRPEVRKRLAEYQAAHREEINRRAREWRAKNPEKIRLHKQRQKAKREASL